MTKICSKCGVEKELSEFNKCKKGVLGYTPCCKECAKVQVKERIARRKRAYEKGEIKVPVEKTCSTCKKIKSIDCFSMKYTMGDLHSPRCKECDKEYKKQYGETHKEFLKERSAYFRNRDPELTKQRKRAEYQRNKEHILSYQAKYRAENKKKIAERDKRYRETHLEQIQTQRQLAHWQLICEDVTKVENYEKAKADNFVNWVQHHRLETHNSDGERRLVQITAEELKVLDMYYNRPAEELIWLTRAEHINIHREIN